MKTAVFLLKQDSDYIENDCTVMRKLFLWLHVVLKWLYKCVRGKMIIAIVLLSWKMSKAGGLFTELVM